MSETMNSTQAEIAPLCEAIATELGNGWHVVDTHYDTQGLKLSDGTVSLFAHYARYGDGKIHFQGDYPEGYYKLYVPSELNYRVETAVALTRDPKAAARQIVAKLIPTVTEATAYFTDKLAGNADALTMRETFLATLAPYGVSVNQYGRGAGEANSARVRIGEIYGDLELLHKADEGTLTLHGLSAEQITYILTYLAS